MNRKLQREWIVKIIYEMNISNNSDLNEIYSNHMLKKIDILYTDKICNYYIEHKNEISNLIDNNLIDNIKKISKIDNSILSTAISEMKSTDIAHSIIVNEAVEISKKYSNSNSYKLINAILAKYIKSSNINNI